MINVSEGRPKQKAHVVIINQEVIGAGHIDDYMEEDFKFRQKIWLRIKRRDNEYTFLYKPIFDVDREWVLIDKWMAPKSFQPKQLALGAFQGITQILPSGQLLPLNWEPVTAHFDYIELQPNP